MDREMLRHARRRAADRGVSLAEYVRSLVERDLGGKRATSDVGEIFGLFDSGGSDVARDEDRMIAEAFDRLHPG
jgi:hypothetical protein